jgi:hypothetical protein
MTNVVAKKYHAIIFLNPIPILRMTEIAKVIINKIKKLTLYFESQSVRDCIIAEHFISIFC